MTTRRFEIKLTSETLTKYEEKNAFDRGRKRRVAKQMEFVIVDKNRSMIT